MGWMKRMVLAPFIGSLVKALINALAGWIIGMNAVSPDTVHQFASSTTEIVVALVLLFITQGFSAKKNLKLVRLRRTIDSLDGVCQRQTQIEEKANV